MSSDKAKSTAAAGGGSNISPSKSRAGSVVKTGGSKEKKRGEESSEESSGPRRTKTASVSDGSGSSTSGSGKNKSAHPGQHRKQSVRGGSGKESGGNNNKKGGAPTGERKTKSKRKPVSWFRRFMNNVLDAGEIPVLKDPKAMEAMVALNLSTKHLKLLKRRFDEIDIDGSGSIDAQELFDAIGEPKSPFTEAVFAIIDIDGSGYIEFDEFVRMAATYCMYTKDEILRFCFEMFDKDGSGAIDERELMILMKAINNAAPSFPGNFRKAMEEFDVNDDGLIDYQEFVAIDRRYPMVLFPAFRLQDALQKYSLGETTWTRIIVDYEEMKRIEEYKQTHDGKMPPMPIRKRLARALCPCCYEERVHMALGASMDQRHRANM